MMTMKISFYLDEKSSEELAREIREKAEEHIKSPAPWNPFHIAGLRFKLDEEGILTETDTFLGGLPSRLAGIPFRRVTIYDEIVGGIFRQHGVYRQVDAEAVVDSFSARRSSNLGFGDDYEECQRVRIVAPDLDSAVNLYKAIRAGQIKPEEEGWSVNYGGAAPKVPEEETPAVESEEPQEASV
jgi:hypothetical protein